MAENRQEQLNKLKALEQKGTQTTSKMVFHDLVVCTVGAPVKEHFPKVKLADGSTKKDVDGNDVRSAKSDGFMYTFSQFGTATKIMAVIPKKYTLELLTAYKVSGLGYQMRQANMIYLDENVQLTAF
ncbi:hypothetical protein [Lactobacillus kefiranofaciens]|uniref:hypothetical protein n=1 Tax=Lactobacillus kefiranofaciens TaxID=267818 RepID=UPI0021C43583|nr:hypothetical protein [Lactobacillus kefiranofaciens]MCP9331720.1 hypothetical protein [Lactobacillus kefiranofaciens]